MPTPPVIPKVRVNKEKTVILPKQVQAPKENEKVSQIAGVVATNLVEEAVKGRGLDAVKEKYFKAHPTIKLEKVDKTVELSPEDNDRMYNEIASVDPDGTIHGVESVFGKPIFDTFTFDYNKKTSRKYTASKESGGGDVVLNEPFTFDSALLTVSQTKNIVRTAISGRNGTVKEYMSEGDYLISLRGTLVGTLANQLYDHKEMQRLVDYLKAPIEIPVISTFIKRFKISKVVVEDYNFNQREGVRNVIDVSIEMLSDIPLELGTAVEVAPSQTKTTI